MEQNTTSVDAKTWDEYATLIESARESQQRGETETAYAAYARASELVPDLAAGWRGRAATTPDADDALVSLAYASAVDANDVALREQVMQQAVTRAASALKPDAGELETVAQKLAQVGLTREAHHLFRRAAELDATREEALLWQAATADDPDEAHVALRQVLTRNPANARARAGLEAVTREQEQKCAIPSGLESEAVPSAPVDPAAEMVAEGERALGAGDKARAYTIFVQATEKSPRSEGAWLGRARTADNIDETLTCLEQVLAINPENTQAREARTFHRVRKLREGVRKMPEPVNEPRFAPTFAGGASFDSRASADVRQRRVVLLLLMVVVLIALGLLLYFRLS